MNQLYKKLKPRFKIEIRDVKKKKTRGFSLLETKDMNIDDLKVELITYFMNKETQ